MTNEPIAVEIVRPKNPGLWLGLVTSYFVNGLLLMWLLPTALHVHPGYWQCVCLSVVARIVFGSTDFLTWTKATPLTKKKVSR